MKLYKFENILNEIATVFDMDQWDDQVNLFTDAIKEQLNVFIYHTKYNDIFILEDSSPHDFPQFYFYKERCYVNGEKVELDEFGTTENKWKTQETVNVTIEDLDQLGESCAYMFVNCESLESVPEAFNTSNVTNMRNMFYGCRSLKTVAKFNTSRVINMAYMFYGCDSLSKETKKVWSSIYDFENDKMKWNKH